MTRCLLIFLLLTIYAPLLPAQATAEAGELIFLQKQPADSAKVNRLNSYAEKIQFSNPETAIQAMEASIATAQKINYPLGLSVAYGLRAGLLFYEMKLDTCRLLLDKAYALVKNHKAPAYKNQAANLINRYAAIEQRKQNFDLAVERYQQAAVIFNETGEYQKIIFSFYNLSGIYKHLGDTGRMFHYANETNRLALQSKDTVSIIRGLIALGDAYNVVKNYDSSWYISRMGLRMAQRQDLTFAIGIFNNFIGLYYTNRALQYDSAIVHFNRALEQFDKINLQYDIALVYQNMGNAYLKKRDFANAVRFSLKAVKIAKELKLDQVLYLSLKDLVLAEEERGNIAQSYLYLKNFVEVSEALQNKNNQKKVYELESRYLDQQKEMLLLAKEKIIEKKNLLNYLLGSGVLTLIMIFALLYRNYRHKQALQQQRIADLETEKKLMAAAAVLKGEAQERTRLAQDLHDGLGGMLSGIKYSFNSMKGQLIMTPENSLAFEHSMDMLDESIQEMRRVAHNMMPEALVKFGLNAALKDFCQDINQTGALQLSFQSIGLEKAVIDQTTSITIYRIVQELVNNTMKHSGARACLVQVSLQQQILSVTVEDDGSGFDASHAQGMGWKNIRTRVEFLKGKLEVQSENKNGTSVHIEINLT
jgi:two-component system, NarL family, sensor kinase